MSTKKELTKKEINLFWKFVQRILREYYFQTKSIKKNGLKISVVADMFIKEIGMPVPSRKNIKSDLVHLYLSGSNPILKSGSKYSKLPRRKKKKPSKSRKKEYYDYLKSAAWGKVKLALFKVRGKECEKCGCKKNIQVHHLHYKNIFKEELEDLMVVCRSCHKKIHGL